MSSTQIFFILLTFLAPPALAWGSRRFAAQNFDRRVRLSLAWGLLAFDVIELAGKELDGTFSLQKALPMQLCDWALFASAAALLLGSQLPFELAYFWGLAGTIQALFTPAIGSDLAYWRVGGFFAIHSGIVIAVLYLVLAARKRPRSLLPILVASEIYVALALAINAAVDGNYGFLSGKPATHSLLDFLSHDHWVYVLQLNGIAITAFLLLYAPWWIADRSAARSSRDNVPTDR